MGRSYKDAESPRAFLENVLDHWTAFCEVNYGLAQAISDLLRDMDRLSRENRLLRIELAREQKKSRHSKSDD